MALALSLSLVTCTTVTQEFLLLISNPGFLSEAQSVLTQWYSGSLEGTSAQVKSYERSRSPVSCVKKNIDHVMKRFVSMFYENIRYGFTLPSFFHFSTSSQYV